METKVTATFRRLVRANAERLLEDARLLAENGRHATAVALAILSLEESGKFLLDRWKEQGFKVRIDKRRQLHKEKQLAVAGVFSAFLAVNALNRIQKESGIDPFSDADKFMTAALNGDETMMAIMEAFQADEKYDLMDHSLLGIFETIKHVCLYVDRDMIRKKFVHSHIGTEDASKRYIGYAAGALRNLNAPYPELLDAVSRASVTAQLKIHAERKAGKPQSAA